MRGSVLSEAPSKVMLLALSANEIAVLRLALLQLMEERRSEDGAVSPLRELLGKLPNVAAPAPAEDGRAPV